MNDEKMIFIYHCTNGMVINDRFINEIKMYPNTVTKTKYCDKQTMEDVIASL